MPTGPQADKAREALAALQARAPLNLVIVTDRLPGTVPIAPGPTPIAPLPVKPRPSMPDQFLDGPVAGPTMPPEITVPTPLPPETPRPVTAVLATATPLPPTFDELMDIAHKQESRNRQVAAISYLRAAREASRGGGRPSPSQALQAAERTCANDAPAHYAVGSYFAEQRQFDEAIDHFQQALTLNPNLHSARMALVGAAVDAGEWDVALVHLKQADQARSDQPEALWMLAQLYDRQLSLPAKATEAYAQFERRFPNDSRASEARQRQQALAATPAKSERHQSRRSPTRRRRAGGPSGR